MNYLEIAARVAKNNISCIGDEYRKNYNFGVVCLRKDGSITISNNILTKDPNPAAHAEKRVLNKGGCGSILYIVRLKRDGSWGIAKPCPHCQTLIKNKRVHKVVYSISTNEYGVWYPEK